MPVGYDAKISLFSYPWKEVARFFRDVGIGFVVAIVLRILLFILFVADNFQSILRFLLGFAEE